MQFKQAIRHCLSLLLAVYFLLGGTGFNIIDYCCPTCADRGIEQVAQVSCSNIHHDHCCNDNCTHNDGCQFIRCTPDDCSIAESEPMPDASAMVLLWHIAPDAIALPTVAVCEDYGYEYRDFSPSSGGRTLLAEHCTLLI